METLRISMRNDYAEHIESTHAHRMSVIGMAAGSRCAQTLAGRDVIAPCVRPFLMVSY